MVLVATPRLRLRLGLGLRLRLGLGLRLRGGVGGSVLGLLLRLLGFEASRLRRKIPPECGTRHARRSPPFGQPRRFPESQV